MKKHLCFIDYLRCFAMTSVIFLHICGVMMNRGFVRFGSMDWELMNLCDSFAYSAVAVFFMISGYLLLHNPRTADISHLLRKRIPRLIIPFLAWTAVAALWIGHLEDDYSFIGLVQRFIGGIYRPIMVHFWFAFSMIAVYAISPGLYLGLNGLDEKGRKYVLIVILVLNLRGVLSCLLPEEVSRYLEFDLLDKLSFFGGAVSCFILGWYLGNMNRQIHNSMLITAGLIAAAVITLGTRVFFEINRDYDSPYHHMLYGFEVILAACVFLLFKQNIHKTKSSEFISRLARLGYPIYFLHVIVMELFFGLGWIPRSFAGSVGFTAVNLLFCFALTTVAASIRPICYLSTGVSFHEASNSCNLIYRFQRLKKRTGRNSEPEK